MCTTQEPVIRAWITAHRKSLIIWAVVVGAVIAVVNTMNSMDPGAHRDKDGRVTTAGYEELVSLRSGDCFDSGGHLPSAGTRIMPLTTVKVVPCDRPHDAEAFASIELPAIAPAPNTPPFAEYAHGQCTSQAEAYILDPWSAPEGLRAFYTAEAIKNWGSGDRRMVCYFGLAGSTLTSSLRTDDAALTTEQKAYLKAAGPRGSAVAALPRGPEDLQAKLPAFNACAARAAAATREEIRVLESTPWSPAVGTEITALVAELRKEATVLDGLARTGQAGAFGEYADGTAYNAPLQDAVVQVRRALGLTTES
ncbi:septum formation family protein [Yinghuangia soli]|uniref:Septum formation family protein n=1 Tax=Yinghuangia soli TaxID=2908204 RepID=A0AA41Q6U0_9ACTN|nr:septum formation family protein [Yinghuangia soli]MCF2531771.1 septum formation family protein [Yinghuangia soli]